MAEPAVHKIRGPGLFRVLTSLRRPPHQLLYSWMRRYGDVVRVNLIEDIYIINNADLAKEILLKAHKEVDKGDFINSRMRRVFGNGIVRSEGDACLQQLIQPALHEKAFDQYERVVQESIASFLEEWQQQANKDCLIDLQDSLKRLTMQIISKVLFSHDLSECSAQLIRDMEAAAELISRNLLLNIPSWIPGCPGKKLQRLACRIDSVFEEMIRQRRSKTDWPDDLLSFLMTSTKADGIPLSDKQIMDEIKSIFLTVVLTSSDAISWTIYLLEMHAQHKHAVLTELTEAIREEDLQFTHLSQLKHLDRVILETQRLYPPTSSLWYHVNETLKVGGYTLPRGATLLIDLFNIHRSAQHFLEPETFIPDRFHPMYVQATINAYMPYGPRPCKCIGADLASTLIPMIVASIYNRFEVEMPDRRPLKEKERVSLTPDRAILLRVAKKQSALPSWPF